MRQYYILNSHPMLGAVYEFIRLHDLLYEIHLNRTRFWVPIHDEIYTLFVLRFADHCPLVDPTLDLLTGR